MDRILQKIREKANEILRSERDEDFVVEDMAGGNVDDAYEFGLREGEILYARELLTLVEQEG